MERTVIEIIPGKPIPIARIAFPKTHAEIATQHRQRFVFKLADGREVILKRITYLDHEVTINEIIEDDPPCAEAYEKISKYNEIAMNQRALQIAWEKGGKQGERPVDFPEELKAERNQARARVQKHNWRSYGPCFVEPKIESKEDLDIFLQNLEPNEREALVSMLSALIAPLPDTDKNLLMLGIANRYGIKWTPELFLTNMTLQQAQLILDTEGKQFQMGRDYIAKLQADLRG